MTSLPDPEQTILGESVQILPGGKGLNQAVAAARAGGDVSLAGCIGSDRWGDELLAFLRTTSVDHSMVRRIEATTGVAIVTVAADGTNSIVDVPGANRCDDITQVASDALATVGPGDVVLAQLEVPPAVVASAFETARDRGATTALNPSPVDGAAPADLQRCLELSNIVVVNQGEAGALGLPGARRPGQLIIETRGAEAVVATDDDGTFSVPARPADAVDTTGAGDCFTGVLVAGVAEGRPLRSSIERAIVAASLQVGRLGAAPAMPDAAEIDASGG